MEAQHEKRVKLVGFFGRSQILSEWRWRNGYGDMNEAKNLTFRIRTTSVFTTSDWEERGTHVSILCLLALTL